jgi:hypothetical protein
MLVARTPRPVRGRAYAEVLLDGLLAQIGELFDVEQLAIERQIVGTAEHLALRHERSAEVVARVFATVESQVGNFDARSSLAKAMNYLLNQRDPLILFLNNARVPIHKNLSERPRDPNPLKASLNTTIAHPSRQVGAARPAA